MRRVAGVLVVAVAMTTQACSSGRQIQGAGPSTTARRTYDRTAEGLVASITDHLAVERPDLNSWAPPSDQAACAAERIVDGVGVDRLLSIGFDPDQGDLTLPYEPAEQALVVEALDDCLDFERALVELIGANGKVSATTAGCIGARSRADGITADVALAFVTGDQLDVTADDNRVGESLVRSMTACVDPNKELVPIVPVDPLPTSPTTSTSDTGDSS